MIERKGKLDAKKHMCNSTLVFKCWCNIIIWKKYKGLVLANATTSQQQNHMLLNHKA
jgi:hypothetical protein